VSALRYLVRGTGVLLLASLSGLSFVRGEPQFAAAGVAVAALVELGLALRARRNQPAPAPDRSRVSAERVTCTEQDGAWTIALVGNAQGASAPTYVLLSRTQRPGAPGAAPSREGPYLELGDPKRSVHGGIREACLTPRLLHLALDTHAAEVLGTGEVNVTLHAGNDQRRLERALARILRGVAFTSERSLPEEEAQEAAASAA
jgi:hypothetical protein